MNHDRGHEGDRAPDSPLSTGTTFSLLADRQRREVLAYLSETDDGTAEVDALVDHLAGEGLDRHEVVTALHHVHLPKMADAGVVEYDRRSGTVRYTGDPSVETTLEAVGDSDLPLP